MPPAASRLAAPQALALALALPLALVAGCDDKAPKPDPSAGKRSEAVQASGQQAAQAAHTPSAAAHPQPPKAPRKLCEAPPAAAGRPFPAGNVPSMSAPGAVPLADKIPTGGGRWTWVNLWAAWCGPCKEEIPRLKAWEAKLAQSGTPVHMVFVSLDDDQRQAQKFLESQPPNGLRSSYWLQEGKPRNAWLEALRLKTDPQLPLQVLADAQGQVRCVIEGAVDDLDFAQVQAIVSRR